MSFGEKGIFISYRQDDAKPWALMLRDDLVEAFGDAHVFLDKDTLHADNWQEQIQKALECCKVVLVVMGRKWLTIEDVGGDRRLDQSGDVHRQKVAYALLRKDVTVIPVLVDGSEMPSAGLLPADIGMLTDLQARQVSDARAHRDVDLALLIQDIERATGLSAKPRAPPASKSRAPLLAISAALSVVLLTALRLLAGWKLEPQEVSLIVLLTCFATWALWKLWRRQARGYANHGKTSHFVVGLVRKRGRRNAPGRRRR